MDYTSEYLYNAYPSKLHTLWVSEQFHVSINTIKLDLSDKLSNKAAYNGPFELKLRIKQLKSERLKNGLTSVSLKFSK